MNKEQQQLFYVTYYHEQGNAKFPKGWYCFAASTTIDGSAVERIVVHKSTYNYSKKSRAEAIEKAFRTRVGLTRSHEFHHLGMECLDYKFDPSKLLAA